MRPLTYLDVGYRGWVFRTRVTPTTKWMIGITSSWLHLHFLLLLVFCPSVFYLFILPSCGYKVLLVDLLNHRQTSPWRREDPTHFFILTRGYTLIHSYPTAYSLPLLCYHILERSSSISLLIGILFVQPLPVVLTGFLANQPCLLRLLYLHV